MISIYIYNERAKTTVYDGTDTIRVSCNRIIGNADFFNLNSSLNLRSPRTTLLIAHRTCAIRNKTREKSTSIYIHIAYMFILFLLSSVESKDTILPWKEGSWAYPTSRNQRIVGTSGAHKEGKIGSGLGLSHRFLPSLLFAAQHVSLSSPLLSRRFLLTRIRTIHCAPSFGSPEGAREVGQPPGRPPLPRVRIVASLQLRHLLVISFARCVRCQGDLRHSYRRLHRCRERALKRHTLAGQLASRIWNLLNFTSIQIYYIIG